MNKCGPRGPLGVKRRSSRLSANTLSAMLAGGGVSRSWCLCSLCCPLAPQTNPKPSTLNPTVVLVSSLLSTLNLRLAYTWQAQATHTHTHTHTHKHTHTQYFDELRCLLPCGADSKFDKNTILQNTIAMIKQLQVLTT